MVLNSYTRKKKKDECGHVDLCIAFVFFMYTNAE